MENKLEKIGQNNFMDNFVKTDDILKDMCGIIESSQKAAYRAVNTTLIQRNWLLGYRIASEELQGEDRAKYGAEIIKKLAKELSAEYGKGYTKSNLYSFYSFYKIYPEIFQTPSGKSVGLLSWSHYAALLQVKAEIETQKAMFYLQQQDNEEKETEEAVKDGEGWLSIEELKEQMGE